MNYAAFATDFADQFREAYTDMSMHRIACLLDKGDELEAMRLIKASIDAAKDAVEADLDDDGAEDRAYDLQRQDKVDGRA